MNSRGAVARPKGMTSRYDCLDETSVARPKGMTSRYDCLDETSVISSTLDLLGCVSESKHH